jgi:hypothetical protein
MSTRVTTIVPRIFRQGQSASTFLKATSIAIAIAKLPRHTVPLPLSRSQQHFTTPPCFCLFAQLTGQKRRMASATIPKTQKGVIIEKNGGTEVLQYKTDLAVPEPKAGEVLVRNEFIGVNYIDTYVLFRVSFLLRIAVCSGSI